MNAQWIRLYDSSENRQKSCSGCPMIVCHCRAQSDRDVQACIEAGASDEFDVAAQCGAGTKCGGCLPMVRLLLSATRTTSTYDEAVPA